MTQLLADMLPTAMLGLFIAMPLGPIMFDVCAADVGIGFGIASAMGAADAHGLFH